MRSCLGDSVTLAVVFFDDYHHFATNLVMVRWGGDGNGMLVVMGMGC